MKGSLDREAKVAYVDQNKMHSRWLEANWNRWPSIDFIWEKKYASMDSAACSHQIDPKCHGLGSCRLFYIRHRYNTSSIEYKPINKLNANYSLRFPTLIHHLTVLPRCSFPFWVYTKFLAKKSCNSWWWSNKKCNQ